MLVVWTSIAISSSPLYQMQEMEKREKGSHEGTWRAGNRMATSA